jgi:protein associated with RNAse G/E
MRPLCLRSKKYDGSLHYRYGVQEVERTPQRLITYSHPGQPVESYRGCWTGTRHLLSIFHRDQPFVQHVRWDGQWQPEFLYVDISTTTSWNDDTVGYIDLDLDLIQPFGVTEVKLDDEDEFEEHRLRWGYPEPLVRACWAAVAQVRERFAQGAAPFCTSMFAWRPGSSLTF